MVGVDLKALIMETANSLRQVQVKAAASAPELRREFLVDELERCLAGVPPNQRSAFMDGLRDAFPAWQSATGEAVDQVSETRYEEPVELTASDYVAGVLACKDELTDDQRQAIATALGMTITAAPPGRARQMPAISTGRRSNMTRTVLLRREDLLRDGSASEQAERNLDLACELGNLCLAIEHQLWTFWGQMAPTSRVKRPRDLRQEVTSFVAGEENHLDDACQQSRRLLAALMASIGQAARAFNQDIALRFSPEEIQRTAEMEQKPKFMQSKESLYWARYLRVCSNMNADQLRKDLLMTLASLTEQNFLASLRNGGALANDVEPQAPGVPT